MLSHSKVYFIAFPVVPQKQGSKEISQRDKGSFLSQMDVVFTGRLPLSMESLAWIIVDKRPCVFQTTVKKHLNHLGQDG